MRDDEQGQPAGPSDERQEAEAARREAETARRDAETFRRDAEALRRETEAARREAEALRREREKAERAAAREADKARKEADKAEQRRLKDVDRARRDAEKLAQQQEKARLDSEKAAARVLSDAQKAADQARRERERAAQDAAREAGRAHLEAERAARAAALAQLRAQRETDKARREAERAGDTPDALPRPGLEDLPRDLAILWQPPAAPRRGPRPGLTLDQIADAAIALADAEGLGAVSMARVAESLGFTTMSLYRYVSSKDEVLMLMADRAAGMPPQVGADAGGWRARLETLLRIMQPVLAEHPWMSRAGNVLFALGPHRLAWMEAMLAALEGTPLTEPEKLSAVGALSSHQLEWARLLEADAERRRVVAQARAEAAGGAVDEEDPNALVARLADPMAHPALTRAVAAGVFAGDEEPDDGLDFGTRLILDGLAAMIASRGVEPSTAPTP